MIFLVLFGNFKNIFFYICILFFIIVYWKKKWIYILNHIIFKTLLCCFLIYVYVCMFVCVFVFVVDVARKFAQSNGEWQTRCVGVWRDVVGGEKAMYVRCDQLTHITVCLCRSCSQSTTSRTPLSNRSMWRAAWWIDACVPRSVPRCAPTTPISSTPFSSAWPGSRPIARRSSTWRSHWLRYARTHSSRRCAHRLPPLSLLLRRRHRRRRCVSVVHELLFVWGFMWTRLLYI